MRELAVARSSIEQDRFARLNRVKKTLQSLEQLKDVERQKVAVLLAADPSFGDAESSSTLLEGMDDGDSIGSPPIESLPTLLGDEQPSALPGEDLDPTVCYQFRSCPVV